MQLFKKINSGIRAKLMFYILSTSTIIFLAAIVYIGVQSTHLALDSAKKMAISSSSEFSKIIKAELDAVFKVTRTLANTAATYYLTDWQTFNKIFLQTQRNVLEKNPGYLSVATSWELQFINPQYTKPYGRFLCGYYRKNGEISYFEAYRNMDGDNLQSNYYKMKTTKTEMLVDPEYYSYSGKADEMILNSNFSTPVLYQDQYIGLAGVDVDLGHFQKICENYRQFEGAWAMVLSNNGTWVASHTVDNIGKLISTTDPEFTSRHQIVEKIQKGATFTFVEKDSLGVSYFYAFSPINNIADPRPWAFGVAIPLSVIEAQGKSVVRLVFLIAVLGFILLTLVVYYLSLTISNPIKTTTKLIKDFAVGKIDLENLRLEDRNDEIGEMFRSLQQLSNGLNSVVEFARQIGSGNLAAEFQPRGEHDVLGQTLLDMRVNLAQAKEQLEKQNLLEQQRRWITESIGKLLQITRNQNSSDKKMAYEALKFIIEQSGAIMGAIYMYNEENYEGPCFELMSAIAYSKQRLVKASFKPGEGLVGRCGFEKLTINLTEIPQEYVKVTSGLGEANPNNIILVPMIYNEQIEGVIELLSFSKFASHQIEFIEKAAENLAATILSIKTNRKTQILLRQSQQQAEILSQQEEEMRQNIEELHAIQEEARKRENEMLALINAIDKVTMIAVYDMDGTLIDINDKFCKVLGITKEQALGKKQGAYASNRQERAVFDKLWRDLRNGKTCQITQQIVINGRELEIAEIYTPALDPMGEPIKVYNIAIEVKKNR